MKWTRVRPGLYTSGKYSVGRLVSSGEWFCDGPGVDGVLPTKTEAQAACQRASDEGGV